MDPAYDEYEPTRAARAIQDFAGDELSNWYVRLNRKRFWRRAYEPRQTGCLPNAVHLPDNDGEDGSPIAPFYTDRCIKT